MDANVKKRILITGVSGLLGSNLALYLKDHYEVWGIYNSHPVMIPGVQTKALDLLDGGALKAFLSNLRPSIIIHCAALVNIDFCEQNQSMAHQINVTATENIFRDFAGFSPKLIYISTDAVYGGDRGGYAEQDPVQLISYYAQTKYLGEQVAGRMDNHLIIRSSFYGWNIVPGKHSLAEWVIHELSNGNPIKGFFNVVSSNIYTQDFARIMHQIMLHDLKGIYNVGCAPGMSKYDFAMTIAEKFGLSKGLIDRFDVDQFPFNAPRGKNLSMCVDKIQGALSQKMPDSVTSIENFYKERRRAYA